MNAREIENALKVISAAQEEGFKAYAVQISENGFCTKHYVAFPRKVDDNGSEYEFIYAMNEIHEEFENLCIGKCIYFQPCRDDKTSKGIITRIL